MAPRARKTPTAKKKRPASRLRKQQLDLIFAKVYLDDGGHNTLGPYALEDLSVEQLDYFQRHLRRVLRNRRAERKRQRGE